MDGVPAASVVVPVRGRRQDLEPLVASLERQTLDRKRFEVVIADDGSPEDLAPLATADGWIRVSAAPPANSYVARNRAARLAQAPVLAFCDADCIPDRDWLERGLAATHRHSVIAGAIRWQLPPRPSIWTLLEVELFVDPERAVREKRCLGGNLFVRREFFELLGGFDESLPSGGDSDFGRRAAAAGEAPILERRAVVWHPATDRRQDLLGKVRRVNRAAGIRDARRIERIRVLRKPAIPVVTFLHARRSAGYGAWLDRRRLTDAGLRPSLWMQSRAVGFLYLVVPHVARRSRRSGVKIGREGEVVDSKKPTGLPSPPRAAPEK